MRGREEILPTNRYTMETATHGWRRERALREALDHLDRDLHTLLPAGLDHVVPAAAGRIGEERRRAGLEQREEAHVVGVVGDHEEVERPRQSGREPGRRLQLLALGEAIRVVRREPRAERARVTQGWKGDEEPEPVDEERPLRLVGTERG